METLLSVLQNFLEMHSPKFISLCFVMAFQHLLAATAKFCALVYLFCIRQNIIITNSGESVINHKVIFNKFKNIGILVSDSIEWQANIFLLII